MMKRLIAVLLIIGLVFSGSMALANDVQSFVQHVYREMLGRDADESGLNNWVELISSGSRSPKDIILTFIKCDEFTSKGYDNSQLVDVIYRTMLQRNPDEEGKAAYLEKLDSGMDPEKLVDILGNSSEFASVCDKYGIGPNNKASNDNSEDIAPVINNTADIEKISAFVTRCYNVILGRGPDPSGLQDWTEQLASGKKTAAEIISGFFGSTEFMSFGYSNDQMVEILYKTMLDRGSDPSGKEHWVTLMNIGKTYKYVINGFCGSREFMGLCATYGITPGSVATDENDKDLNPGVDLVKITAFVTRCYNLILSRDPDMTGLKNWVNALASGERTASEIIMGFVGSTEFRNKNVSNADTVEILYRTMLDRGSDSAGKANWVGVLNTGNPVALVINGFCGSTEFNNLCNEYGITPGSVKITTGWQTSNGQKYFFNENGKKTTGIKWVGDGMYMFDDNGVMLTGWQIYNDKKYFLREDGKMLFDWNKIGDQWYYFNKNGELEREGPVYGSNTGVCLTDYKNQNDDFVAWMKIPDTNVNYPVVCSDSVDYYLDHNFDGDVSKDGTLLSLGKCDWQAPSKNIVIYGHHVEAGSDRMFKALLKYKEENYYLSHPVIYLDSMYSSAKYRIFAVFDILEGTIDPTVTSFGSDREFLDLVAFVKSISHYDTHVTVNANDKIITLVTCDRYYKPKVGRLIVMAVRE